MSDAAVKYLHSKGYNVRSQILDKVMLSIETFDQVCTFTEWARNIKSGEWYDDIEVVIRRIELCTRRKIK